MPIINRRQAKSNHLALLRLAAGPTALHDGSRRVRHSAKDAAVYEALVSHHNWRTGRCDPGYRAIQRCCGRISLDTVSASIHRLKVGGFIRVRRRPIRVPGHGLRWAYSYTLIPVPRSELVTEPTLSTREEKTRWLGDAAPAALNGPQAPMRSVEEQLALLMLPLTEMEASARRMRPGAG